MKRVKKTGKKFLTALAVASMLCSLPTMDVQAAAADAYLYSVTIYAGNQGTFSKDIGIEVDHRESGNTAESQVKIAKGMITLNGLKKDDLISIDLRSDSVSLKEEGRYYVKGIRQSGRDNGEVATSIFRVDRDADYVVAYGVQADMVAYTVNYQDAAGNELLPSETFYGSVGDKPVVAYRYKDGYDPEVRALTKTLDANEAKNVFTFVYTPTDRETVTRQVGTAGTTTVTDTVTGILPGQPGTVTTTETTTGGGETPNEEDAGEGGGEAAEDTAEDTGGETADEAEESALQEIGDEEVPLADTDLKDLDEEEVPASDIQLDKVVKKGLPLATSVWIAVAAVIGLGVLAVIVKKRKKHKKGAV